MDHVEFFDKYAHNWDKTERDDIDARVARVIAIADVEPGDYVLDVGTGTGVAIPHILAAAGNTGRVLAVDISENMLDCAKAKGFSGSVEYMLSDIEYTGLSDVTFDRVICNAAFPHFADRKHALSEMVRLLKPGGTLVISHPIGREAVNNLHKNVGEVVTEDSVPTAEIMDDMLVFAGLIDVFVIDEPEFYAAFGRKSSQTG